MTLARIVVVLQVVWVSTFATLAVAAGIVAVAF